MIFKRFLVSISLIVMPFMLALSIVRLANGNDPFVSIHHVKSCLELYDPPNFLRERLFNDSDPNEILYSDSTWFSRITGAPSIKQTSDAEKLLYYVLLFPIDLIGDIGYTLVFVVQSFNFLGSV